MGKSESKETPESLAKTLRFVLENCSQFIEQYKDGQYNKCEETFLAHINNFCRAREAPLIEALHFALKTMVNHGCGYECDFCDVEMDDDNFIHHKEDCPIEKIDAAITNHEEAAG